MSASNFNLRGLPSEVMVLLKREAKRSHLSVNLLILKMIERGLGLTHERLKFHDLDHLADSWSPTDAKTFEKNTEGFEHIDADLWS